MVTAPFGLRLRLHLRLILARHRRAVIATLLALCVASALSALRPSSPVPATAPVPVSRRDLPAGHRLTAADLITVAWARAALPAGILAQPAGRVLAAPLRRGEPVTDVRVMTAGGRVASAERSGEIPPSRVVVAVRLSDPASCLLTAPGDHVQVISGPPLDPVSGAAIGAGSGGRSEGGSGAAAARVVVRDALVLEVPSSGGQARAAAPSQRGSLLGALAPSGANSLDRVPEPGAAGSLPEGVLALAVLPDDALHLAAVTGVRSLSVARAIARPG